MYLAMSLLFPVNRPDFLLIMLNYGFIDPLFIIVVRSRFDFDFEVKVLGKEEAMQEFGAEGEAASIFEDHVDKLTFSLVDDVMIANDLIALLLFGDAVASASDTIAN